MRLIREEGNTNRSVLSGYNGINDPIALNDGRFLRITSSLILAPGHDEPLVLMVQQSSYQFQSSRADDDWIFRYDYLRTSSDRHPSAHLQIHGILTADVPMHHGVFERVHFPTGRVTLEAVIRCLIEQFGVPANRDPAVWRAVLSESERTFLDHATQPLSGPAA